MLIVLTVSEFLIGSVSTAEIMKPNATLSKRPRNPQKKDSTEIKKAIQSDPQIAQIESSVLILRSLLLKIVS